MKKRLISILLILCMVLSVLPMAAFAVDYYDLYIDDFQFSSNSLTYTGQSGSAVYDPGSKTLTLKSLRVKMNEYNTVIYSKIDGLNIVVDGETVIDLTDQVAFQDNAGAMGFALNGDTVIRGQHGDKSRDKITITSNCSKHTGSGITHLGIASGAGKRLTVTNVSLSMTDTTTGSLSGQACFVDCGGNVEFSGCSLTASGCIYGLFMEQGAGATVKNTEFDMTLSGTDSSGVNLAAGTTNRLENCTGTISADYPLYSYGNTTVTGSGKLTLKGGMGVVVKKYADAAEAGTVTFENANIEIQSTNVGLQVEQGGSVVLRGGNVSVTASKNGAALLTGGKLELQSGELTLTGTGAANSAGISMTGPVQISGGKLTVSDVDIAVKNVSTYTATFSGGSHSLTASTVGYADNAAGALTVENTADVTFNAPTAVQLSRGKGGKLNLTGGKLTLNCTDAGLSVLAGAGKATLSGGTLNVNDTGDTPNATGIWAGSEVAFSGANVNFTGCKTDLTVANSSTKLTAGKISLSGSQFGMNVGADFTMSGGEIVSTGCVRGIVANGATATLAAGKVSVTASYPFWAANGGTLDFAGAEVLGNSTANCAVYIDPNTEGNSYKITGGTVELQSSQAAANTMYTSIPADFGVWAGKDRDSAKRIPSPTLSNSLGGSKYVRIAKVEAYTLTLVNVKEGTSASHMGGDTITYTAKDALAGQHFSHWELTVDGKTTGVGTNAVYSGTMPYDNATLTAVYEDCSGGKATCTERAVCGTCGRAYGDLAAHSYTAETVEDKYLKSEATCTEAAVYYKSCTGCGESSKGTEFEATFVNGNPLGHDFGTWTSNGDGTHTRTCGRDASHKENGNCSGGTADCNHKAVCALCGSEYGELGQHNYTAENSEETYLKSEATCTEAAVYYKSCTGCGESSKGTAFEATFTRGNSLGHSFGTWTSNGDGTHTRICARDAGHTESGSCSGGTADCKHKAVCALCGSEYGELGRHNYTAENSDGAYLKSEATCTEAAVYYKSCAVCGESSKGTERETTFVSGDPLGHDEVTDPGRAATCTETGLTDGKHCARCDAVLTEQNEIPALGHDVPTGTVRKAASCTEEGEMLGTCLRCGEENVTGVIAKLPHQEISLPAVAASCSSSGWTEGKKCTVCGQVTEGHELVWPLGHTIVEDRETATLTVGKHCSVCGEIIVSQVQKGGDSWLDEGNYDAELYASDPGDWVIYDAADLAALSKKVSDGSTFSGCTITLASDIDLSGHMWVPIGQYIGVPSGQPVERSFQGTFLGGRHKITGMRFTSISYYGSGKIPQDVGLFGRIRNAAITDLMVEGNVYYETPRYGGSTSAGGIVGIMLSSTLRNCGFVGSVYSWYRDTSRSFAQYSGGLTGQLREQSVISNCFAIADITTIHSVGPVFSGGLVGTAANFGDGKAVIENCYSACNVWSQGREEASLSGAFVAKTYYVPINNCYGEAGFNQNGITSDEGGTYISKATAQAASGTVFDGNETPLVDALNGYIEDTWRTAGTLDMRSWIVDPGKNDGYPVYGAAVAAKLDSGFTSPVVQHLAQGGTADASLFQTPDKYLVEWYADEDYTTAFDFSQPIYDNTLVYGKLTSNTFPITYVLNGGQNAASNPARYFRGDGVAAFEAPTRENYLFGGWFTDEGFTEPIDSIPADATGGYTLFAKWTLDPDHAHQLGSCIVGADGLHDRTCLLCGETFDCTYTDAVTEPTCYSAGYTTHTCDACGNSFLDSIVEGGHKWTAVVHEPTHTDMGYTVYTCSVCQETYISDYTEPLGHSFDEGTVTQEATCTEEGEMTYSCDCGATHTAPIPKADHELEETVTAPTCTEMGYTTHACRNCDYAYVDGYTAAAGHKWDGGRVTTAPTLTETGKLVQSCTVCNAKKESLIPMLTSCDGGSGCPSLAYTDVPGVTHWSHVGIDFVLKSGLFYGTSDTAFSPNGEMTRAMLVTVLYRLEGQPRSTAKNPFSDVAEGTWYTDAVTWAAENEIVSGIGGGKFDPNGRVTREQMAAILYRYARFKGLTITAGSFVEEYPDVEEISGYAREAMAWANANGIISGTQRSDATYLDPKGSATRAQVASILMRFVKNLMQQ